MTPAPLNIGNLKLEVPLILAPMAGYTHVPFRALCREFHAALTFTEVVMSEGIIRHSPQTMHYFESESSEQPVAAHIYGANPDSMAKAAAVIDSLGRFDMLDINCGCPVPKIKRKGAGVALMKNPEKIKTIVEACSQNTSLPVTIKTRIGLTENMMNISEVAHAAQEGGAKALFLHARLACNKHSGPADWALLKRIKSQLDIPVIGNGGVDTAPDADAMLEETGVDGVMIGRAAIGNPWIFKEVYSRWTGRTFTPPTLAERRAVIEKHLRSLYELMQIEDQWRRRRQGTEKAACLKFRAHLVKYMSGMRGLREMLRKMDTMISIETVMAAVDEVLTQQENE